MSRFIVSLIPLILIYALVLDSFQPWDLLSGALIAGGLLLFFRQFLFGKRLDPLPGLFKRIVAFGPFAGAVIGDVLRGTWQITLIALHLRPLVSAGVVALPMGHRTPQGVIVSALVTTLSPGTVLIDLDWEQRLMLFHVLDASDPEAVRSTFERFYQRYQRYVFP